MYSRKIIHGKNKRIALQSLIKRNTYISQKHIEYMEIALSFETYMTFILYNLDFEMTLIFEQASVEYKYAVTLCEI